jgi:hypothetical protein
MRCRAANAKTINWECTQAIRLEILKLGQATKGQTNTIGGNPPPDRDCSDSQIKTAREPEREVDGRHARITKRPHIWRGALVGNGLCDAREDPDFAFLGQWLPGYCKANLR